MDAVPRIFLICSGLGRFRRGYESFAREAFDCLRTDPRLELFLFKGGGGSGPGEFCIRCIPRNSRTALRIAKYTRKNPYFIEEATFIFNLLPYIGRYRPDVIYFSDNDMGNFLWYWRRLTGGKYKLFFINSGPVSPSIRQDVFCHCDHVQQVVPKHLQDALKAGVPSWKQSLVPLGFNISPRFEWLAPEERRALRVQLGLPIEQPLVISVGAINKYKRMDYVIQEFSMLAEPRPCLLLLGEQDSDSANIIDLGNKLLEPGKFQAKTVEAARISDYYKVADMFVLASLTEGFGRVFVEAMSHGLPCLAHDCEVLRFVLGKYGHYADCKKRGALADLIRKVFVETQDGSVCRGRHEFVYEHFSWDKLRKNYVDMLCHVLKERF